MPGSVTSAFSEQEDFEAALRAEGCLGLLITGRGEFRAQLTQITLHRLRVSAAEERLSRIAFVAVPVDMILMSFATGTSALPTWGGIAVRTGEIVILGSGQRLHARTEGVSRWGMIRLPVEDLTRYGRALTGAPFAVSSSVRCWRPPPAAGRELCQLHAAAIRMAQARPQALVDAEAAHGLEQQLIYALVDCLSAGSAEEATPVRHRHQDVMVRFEGLLQTRPSQNLTLKEICTGLDVSERTLRTLCAEQLGMSPTGYLRLRRMSLVQRALRRGDADAVTVSEAAMRQGFRSFGRFAADYRALFGELPSVTLRRRLRAGMPVLARRRSHLRV
ncbi:MAG TPA: helix-turn-helix domain-containing protein [Stellaceae bacterium]|nr:helix-turn-helix domain-containing protein [Stellaceae bacterium]